MDPLIYQKMAHEQETHWWFKARREIISSVVATMGLTKNSRILEIGCGPGGSLKMLEKFGRIEAVEKDDFSRAYAQYSTGVKVVKGSLPDDIANIEKKFDLVCLFDVPEHIEQDIQALAAVRKLLKDNGCALITVPAYQWLYGQHDKCHHHFRRYSKLALLEKSKYAILFTKRIGYFNCLLFPFLVFVSFYQL